MSPPSDTSDSLVARVRFEGGERFAAPLPDGKYSLFEGSPFTRLEPAKRMLDAAEFALLPPVAPTKIIGIGVNYEGEEAPPDRGFPSMFLMPPSALVAAGAEIELPWLFRSALAEGELAVVISQRARRIRPEDAERYILGYTIANDLSGRDSVLETVPASVKKGSDGLLPLGPHLLLCREVRNFELRTEVNGEVAQSAHTSQMIFGVRECLAHVSSVFTLEAGDVISLGTPQPKPRVMPGDSVSVTIPGIGSLNNRLRKA